jgi:polar amino acid transport system substrate-binding protein
MKLIVLAMAVAAAVPAFAAPLRLLTEDNPPFNFKDGKEVKGTSTQAVQALMKKAGLDSTIEVLPWDDAYTKAQSSANTCLFGTARLENREALFKWYGPIGANVWALYALPSFTKKLETARDARFHVIGGVKRREGRPVARRGRF